MPRAARATVGRQCYHVFNRGNNERRVFYKDADYRTFLKALDQACMEMPMRILSWCLMPNHFHMVLYPKGDRDLSQWMHWLINTHVRRYHTQHHSSGHLWQGRFKSFVVQPNDNLLTVLRYVEGNALRAGLVKRAEQWAWSSLSSLVGDEPIPSYWHEGPVTRPDDWVDWVNAPLTVEELAQLRLSVTRGRPYGEPAWQRRMAAKLGVEASLRPRGRPRKNPLKDTQ